MKNMSVIIVAGGSGQRMGSVVPKQFMLTRGRPVLMWSLEAFAGAGELIVVLPAEHRGRWLDLCREYDFRMEHILVDGGCERYESVRRGLLAVGEDSEYIAVHDGVRPWVSLDVISGVLDAARRCGAAIPVIGVSDTVRIIDGDGGSRVLDRSSLRAVQTPQIFRRDILIHSYMMLSDCVGVTDDASVVECAGYDVELVDGDVGNIKITYSGDL